MNKPKMFKGEIELLTWDTEFFGIKTGRIHWDENFDSDYFKLIYKSKKESYKLIYIFCSNESVLSNKTIKQTGAKLCDEKITFHKKISPSNLIPDKNISPFLSSETPEKLIDLGIQSGEFSRFKTDENFTPGKFEELYTKWVENSVAKTIADEVFIYSLQNDIAGFITIKCHPAEGVIGLIAVDTKYRGRAIGTNLIHSAENYCLDNNIDYLTVVTQLANTNAVNFYRKNNFTIREITNIYHLWML